MEGGGNAPALLAPHKPGGRADDDRGGGGGMHGRIMAAAAVVARPRKDPDRTGLLIFFFRLDVPVVSESA